jgi:C_GCAxxG_C_C family probable redox protein
MHDSIEQSKVLFDSGYGCAEAVLLAVAEYKNIQSGLIPRIASGLCGGIGKTNGMCGAVSGAVLAISLVYGRDSEVESKDILNEKIQELMAFFKEKYGTINCTELTGCDLSTDKGLEKFDMLNKHSLCREFVGETTGKIVSLIK